MTCSVNHSTITTKFCSVCGAPATTAQAPAQPPQWNQPPAAAPQWNQPPAQPYMPPAQPYAPQPTYGAPQQAWGTPPAPLAGFPFPLASTGKRIGAVAIDAGLVLVTCFIGWFIWTLIVWKDGQTPGKQLLKMRTYGTVLARPATWGHMAVRQFLIPQALSVVFIPYWIAMASYDPYSYYSTDYSAVFSLLANLAYLGFYIAELVVMLNSPLRQRITDKWAKTVILDESYRY